MKQRLINGEIGVMESEDEACYNLRVQRLLITEGRGGLADQGEGNCGQVAYLAKL